MIGRYDRPSRNSRRSFIFVPALPAIHIRALAQGVECLTLGRALIHGFGSRLVLKQAKKCFKYSFHA
jgi:hypothetical protein